MSVTNLHFTQINLHHSKCASAVLARSLAVVHTHIALIQEPWLFRGRIRGINNTGEVHVGTTNGDARACVVTKGIDSFMLQELSSRDCTTIRINIVDERGRGKDILVCSAYFPHDEPSPTEIVRKVIEYSRQRNINLIIGCDSNSHHEVWGSTDTNDRGEQLLEFLTGTRMIIANQGRDPTFVTRTRSEVLDLTLSDSDLGRNIQGWRVSEEPSMSDHMTIRFKIVMRKRNEEWSRNPKTTDWSSYRTELRERVRLLKGKYGSEIDLEGTITLLEQAMINSYENNCPLKPRKPPRSAPWWNGKLDKMRKGVRQAFNKARKKNKPETWDLYRERLRKFKIEVKEVKKIAWRDFCTGVDDLAGIAKLSKILSRDNDAKLGLLKDHTGKYVETERETLSILLRKNFPSIELEEGWREERIINITPRAKDWKTAARIVSPEKVAWAIQSFEPYKSPGPDGIYPKLLQEGLDSCLGIITGVLRGSIAVGYIPARWKETRVVFIPKPGKNSYAEAGNFRPISLTSFFLKTLERLVDRYIRSDILKDHPLHGNQHAYQGGKSTETALHNVVGHIEKALEDKEVVIAAFIDIEGAFNCTLRKDIETAALRQGIPQTVVRWIVGMLGDRKVFSEWKGTKVEGIVSDGCPQGGVLSPLLWTLVADELLRMTNDSGVITVGYADDFALLVKGKYEEVLPDILERTLGKVKEWCEGKKLRVNPTKTDIVIFTRKYKLRTCRKIKFYDESVSYVEGTNYLGVYLDRKLKWGIHLQRQSRKVLCLFMQCKAAIGNDWGLRPEKVLWIYRSILLPKLTYASLVWWKAIESKTRAKILEHVQAVIVRGALGVRRSTPTMAINMLLNQASLELVVVREAARAAYRLSCGGQWVEGKTGHKEIKGRVLTTENFQMPQDKMNECFLDGKKYGANIPTRQQWETGQGPGNGLIWFTDGSKTEKGTGLGICGQKRSEDESYSLKPQNTIFQAEIAALGICAKKLRDRGTRGEKITICTDSKASLMALCRKECNSHLVYEVAKTLNKLAEENEVQILWVPSHSGYHGNERADTLAKKGALGQGKPLNSVGIPYQVGLDDIDNWIGREMKKTWVNSQRFRWTKELLGLGGHNWTRKLIHLNRRSARTVIGLLTGHCGLRCYEHKLDREVSNLCRWCEKDEETPSHVLCKCPELSGIRHKWLGANWKETLGEVSVENLLAFGKALGITDTH